MTGENMIFLQIGALLIMAVYHAVLYVQIRRPYYILMSLIVTAVLVRTVFMFEGTYKPIYEAIPFLADGLGYKLVYISGYITLALVPMFMHSLYEYPQFAKFIKYFQWTSGILLSIVVFTPFSIYLYTLHFYHVSMILAFVYSFAILYKAVKENRTSAIYIFVGLMISFVFVAIEMLRVSGLMSFQFNAFNLVSTGVVLYLFFQSMALSAIFAQSFKENKLLNEELEKKVAARTEQLSQSNEIKDRFISIISHDLRSPLANLKGVLAMVEAGILTDQEMKEMLPTINKNMDSSLKMLSDLLEWTNSHAMANRTDQSKDKVELIGLLAECMHLYQEAAGLKDIKLVLNEQGPVNIESDANALRVIYRNLISNAIKFTPIGGRVEVQVSVGEYRFMTSVIDSGIGVPDEMKKTLFEINKRNRRAGTANEKSTGIGLSLCKDLVVQNGGSIWVDNNQNGPGAVFKCSFPIYWGTQPS